MISSISLFEIIYIVILDPSIFLFIRAPSLAAAVNFNGIKTLLTNGLITFSIKSKPFFINAQRSLPTNPLNCIILGS